MWTSVALIGFIGMWLSAVGLTSVLAVITGMHVSHCTTRRTRYASQGVSYVLTVAALIIFGLPLGLVNAAVDLLVRSVV